MKYYKKIEDIDKKNAFIAIIESEVYNKAEILNILSDSLKFPSYFGFNWDAFDECIGDFHWIREYKILIIHSDIPKLEENDLLTYIYLLDYAIQDWIDDGNHKLEVYFPIENKFEIEELIEKSKMQNL